MPRFTLRINGRSHQVEAEADDRLLSVLRYDLGLTGSKYSLLKTTPNPSDKDIARLMQGHVCRCGTYARIVNAVKLAASRTKSPAKPATESGSRS